MVINKPRNRINFICLFKKLRLSLYSKIKHMEKIELISPYSFPGIKKETLNKKKYSYLFTPMELRLTKEDILEIISEESGLKLEQILSRSRRVQVVDARTIYCKILKNNFDYKLVQIGKEIQRDHTTVIHNIRIFNDRYKNEENYKNLSDRILKRVGAKLK